MKKIIKIVDFITVSWMYILFLAIVVFVAAWFSVGLLAVVGLAENINYACPRISSAGVDFTVFCLIWFIFRETQSGHLFNFKRAK